MATGKKPQAKFDFSKVGRKWQEQFAESAERVSKIIVNADRPLRRKRDDEDDQDYDDYVQAYYDAKENMAPAIRKEGDFQANLVAEVLVDVPSEWLLPDAPAHIDWSKSENMDYIQAAYYADILEQVRGGEAMKRSKNSAGTTH